MTYPNFLAAIDQLGTTNPERAARLQMSARALEKWKRGEWPRLVKVFAKNPDLLMALVEDAHSQIAAKETSQTS